MKKRYKKYQQPFLICLLMFLAVWGANRIVYERQESLSARDLARNQNLVLDVEFNNTEALGNIGAPTIRRQNLLALPSLNYNIEGIKSNDKNIVYFSYHLSDLEANTDYEIKVDFDFSSTTDAEQRLYIGATSEDISQGPDSNNPNKLITNIDLDKNFGNYFYVLDGINNYGQTIEQTSSGAGTINVLIGITVGDSETLNFAINNFQLQVIPKVSHD